jgi:hypothetical protein
MLMAGVYSGTIAGLASAPLCIPHTRPSTAGRQTFAAMLPGLGQVFADFPEPFLLLSHL